MKVVPVNTMRMPGKARKIRTRKGIYRNEAHPWKKAIVTLAEGREHRTSCSHRPTSWRGRKHANSRIQADVTRTTRHVGLDLRGDHTLASRRRSLLAKKNRRRVATTRASITARHRGGGVKRRYRIIDFKRNKFGVPAKVFSIEYDPNRSARIALLHYVDGEKRYILAPNGLKVGDHVMSGPEADIRVGNALPLRNIPTGTVIHNIELHIGRGGQIVRSAGASAQLMAKEGDYAACVCLPASSGACISTAWRRSARSAISITRTCASARPALALSGPPPACARLGDEPGGSPAWWWRGARADRRPAADALGQASAGLSHPPQQAHR